MSLFAWKYLLVFGVLSLVTACKSAPPASEAEESQTTEPAAEEEAEPPRFFEPEMYITAIKVLQADLINTRFKLSLRIDNPNTFQITLVSLRYKLYGDGRLWADGSEKDLAVVPALGSAAADIEFEMNFIDMGRRLFDDIVAMRQVRYRISGDVEVEPDAPELPNVIMQFDHSGDSPVLR